MNAKDLMGLEGKFGDALWTSAGVRHCYQWQNFKTRFCKERLHKSRYYGLLNTNVFWCEDSLGQLHVETRLKQPIQINSVLSRRFANPNIICEDSIGFWNLSTSIKAKQHNRKTTIDHWDRWNWREQWSGATKADLSNQFPGTLGTLPTITTNLNSAKSIVEVPMT